MSGTSPEESEVSVATAAAVATIIGEDIFYSATEGDKAGPVTNSEVTVPIIDEDIFYTLNEGERDRPVTNNNLDQEDQAATASQCTPCGSQHFGGHCANSAGKFAASPAIRY
jgi:hypothetical protein